MEHELWSFSNALLFVILIIIVLLSTVMGSRAVMDIKRIKADWPNQRCTPLIMPFAGWFGVNAKENFDFCMGKIFTGHSQSHLGSVTSIFGRFTALLTMIFQSINSMRNTVATLGGGINVVFQEFTERISMFFFRLRLTGIYMKSLFMRMYALLFSVMYMGMSGVTGMTSFTNTYLFSFIDTFCFPGDTQMRVIRSDGIQTLPIRQIQIGDRLYPSMDRVTALFQFHATGQPMVRLNSVHVSSNHYVYDKGKRVRAEHHSDAIPLGPWMSEDPLYCLNTDTHHLPIDGYVFMDYDETPSADKETMRWVESHLNSCGSDVSDGSDGSDSSDSSDGCGMALHPSTRIRMASGSVRTADTLRIGDQLSTGSVIVGVILKEVHNAVVMDQVILTPSTLYWDTTAERWKRCSSLKTAIKTTTETMTTTTTTTTISVTATGTTKEVPSTTNETPTPFYTFVVLPNSQIELESGLRIRDYLEWCSPDTEKYYAEQMTQ